MRMIFKIVCAACLFGVWTSAARAANVGDDAATCCTHAPQEQKPDQKPPKFDSKQFKHDLSMHIVREAGLTPEEAHKFFPVFFELKEKMRDLERQQSRALRKAAEKGMNERDCERVLDEMGELMKKAARVESQYNDRLKKIVGARKLVKALVAEKNFGRKMFRKMTKK